MKRIEIRGMHHTPSRLYAPLIFFSSLPGVYVVRMMKLLSIVHSLHGLKNISADLLFRQSWVSACSLDYMMVGFSVATGRTGEPAYKLKHTSSPLLPSETHVTCFSFLKFHTPLPGPVFNQNTLQVSYFGSSWRLSPIGVLGFYKIEN